MFELWLVAIVLGDRLLSDPVTRRRGFSPLTLLRANDLVDYGTPIGLFWEGSNCCVRKGFSQKKCNTFVKVQYFF